MRRVRNGGDKCLFGIFRGYGYRTRCHIRINKIAKFYRLLSNESGNHHFVFPIGFRESIIIEPAISKKWDFQHETYKDAKRFFATEYDISHSRFTGWHIIPYGHLI